MLLFWRTQKRRKDKRQEPQGQRDSQQAGERRKPRTCRPSERKRGAGKQPLRLCRVTNKTYRSPERSESGAAAWALERERARKKKRSKAHRERKRPRRLAERLEDEARTTDARRTRARASKPRRNGAGKEREEKAAHVTNYPRSLRYARGAHRREAQRSKQAHGESTPKPKQCERIATRARPTRGERKEQTAERSGADRRRSATAAVSIRR